MFPQKSCIENILTEQPMSCHRSGDSAQRTLDILRLKSVAMFILLLIWSIGITKAAAAQSTTTTIAVTSGGVSVSTAAPGALITLLATVQSGEAPVTTGTVNFCNADALLCTDINLIGTAQLSPAGTAAVMTHAGFGSHSYVAKYMGSPNGAAAFLESSSSRVTLNASVRAPSTTAIAATGVAGSYTLTGTVTATGGVPVATGTVSFVDTTNGSIVFASGSLTVGTQSVTVDQPGELAADSNTSYNAVAAGDFNGDGNPDLAVVDSGNQIVVVFLCNGDGTFTKVLTTSATGAGARDLAVGDFNDDGKLDLAVANSGDKTVTVLLGKGDGTFTPTSQSPGTELRPGAIGVADFNRDGQLDLAVVNSDSRTVTILLGAGDGSFMQGPASPGTGTDPGSIAVGDFNGDGIADIATESYLDNTVSLWLGNGDGSFTIAVNSPFSVAMPTGLAAGDLNADGRLDLAVSETNSQLTVLVGNGTGSFAPVVTPLISALDHSSVTTGDFNADGIADLAIQYPTLTKMVLGKGNGTFTQALDISSLAQTQYQAVADFNRDDVVDLAVAHTVCDMNTCPAGVTISSTGIRKAALATVTGIAVAGSGTHDVSASYDGDAVIAPSVSATIPLTATDTDTDTGAYAISATSLTLAAGQSGLSTITASSITGYAGTISLSCSVTSGPAGAIHLPTCTTGQTVTLSSSVTEGTATVQVGTTPSTTVTAAALPGANSERRWVLGGSGAALGCVIMMCAPRIRRKWLTSLSTFLLAGVLGSILGCAAGSSRDSSSNQLAASSGTTPGAYVLTVSAVGSDTAKARASTTFTLTVR